MLICTLVRVPIVQGSLWRGKERKIAGHLSESIRVYLTFGTLPVVELVPGKKRPDIHSAVTAKADDALGRDAFLSFRHVLTGLHIGIGKQAPT